MEATAGQLLGLEIPLKRERPLESLIATRNVMRIEVIHNGDRRKAILLLPGESPTAEEVLSAACNRFRLKPKKFRLFYRGSQLQSGSHSLQDGSSAWLVGEHDLYKGPLPEAYDDADKAKASVTILDGSDVWIDPEAIEQVGHGANTSYWHAWPGNGTNRIPQLLVANQVQTKDLHTEAF